MWPFVFTRQHRSKLDLEESWEAIVDSSTIIVMVELALVKSLETSNTFSFSVFQFFSFSV